MRVLIENVLDLTNLRVIIQEADILFNMAGIVTLSSKPDGFAKIITINGFAQGIITHFIHQMGREKDVKLVTKEEMNPDLTLARRLLGRDLIPMRLGSRKTIDGCVQSSHLLEPIILLQYLETFKPVANEDSVPETTLKFARSGDRLLILLKCPLSRSF